MVMRVMFVAFITACCMAAPVQAADCSIKQIGSVDLSVLPSKEVLLPVTINGVPRTMQLEIESGFHMITAEASKALDLPSGSAREMTIGGSKIERVATGKLQLGPVTQERAEFAVLPRKLGNSADGILGTGIFTGGNRDFDIDLAHSKLGIFLPDHCPGQAVYWGAGPIATLAFSQQPVTGIFMVDMMLDGQKVRVQFSTNGSSRMSMRNMRRIFHLDGNSEGMTRLPLPAGTPVKAYSYTFKKLEADGVGVLNPKIFLLDDPRDTGCAVGSNDCYGDVDIKLGPDQLSKLHLYFSIKERVVYITAAETSDVAVPSQQ